MLTSFHTSFQVSDFGRGVNSFIDEQEGTVLCATLELDEPTKAAILLLLPRSKRFWTYFSD